MRRPRGEVEGEGIMMGQYLCLARGLVLIDRNEV